MVANHDGWKYEMTGPPNNAENSSPAPFENIL